MNNIEIEIELIIIRKYIEKELDNLEKILKRLEEIREIDKYDKSDRNNG